MLVTTSAYKERLARVIMGEALDITPATFKLGDGRYDPVTGVLTDPTEDDSDVESVIMSDSLANVTRYGQTVVAVISVAGGGSGLTFTEAALFTQDGLCIAIDSFRPYLAAPAVTSEIRYTIMPGA